LPRQLRLHEDEALLIQTHVDGPAEVILAAARAPDVELLLLTTHGRNLEPGRSLGQVARAVVARARDPIVLVRPEAVAHPGAQVPPLRRLLIPLDGTPTTATALRPALDVTRRLGAALDLLVVAPADQPWAHEPGAIRPPYYVDQPQYDWPAWAARVVTHLSACLGGRPLDVPTQVFLTAGSIADEVARFAAEHHSDTVVLVRRSHLEVGRARVLRAVLECTPCPVLLLGAS
jgi:nucleotide-binding universal stress UspA family protein